MKRPIYLLLAIALGLILSRAAAQPVTPSSSPNVANGATSVSASSLIPGGTFEIGDTLDNIADAVTNIVNVSAFYMDVNLVNYSQWQSVFNWATNNGYGFDNAGSGKAANHPVQTVNWYDCVKWCNARSQQAGLMPAYYMDAGLTQIYTNGDIDITNANVNWAANGYRLPTEAEWEKAARSGLSGQRYPWGDTISESQANYRSFGSPSYDLGPPGFNSIGMIGGNPYTSPVGSFATNGYGLFDMSGNVFEWCWDWYQQSPSAGSPYLGGTNPSGPMSGSARVMRGGNYYNSANLARCAYRNFNPPKTNDVLYGFRCVQGSATLSPPRFLRITN